MGTRRASKVCEKKSYRAPGEATLRKETITKGKSKQGSRPAGQKFKKLKIFIRSAGHTALLVLRLLIRATAVVPRVPEQRASPIVTGPPESLHNKIQ